MSCSVLKILRVLETFGRVVIFADRPVIIQNGEDIVVVHRRAEVTDLGQFIFFFQRVVDVLSLY
jgi:hypothetical protein